MNAFTGHVIEVGTVFTCKTESISVPLFVKFCRILNFHGQERSNSTAASM